MTWADLTGCLPGATVVANELQTIALPQEVELATEAPTVGWIGTGRMGFQLAARLLDGRL